MAVATPGGRGSLIFQCGDRLYMSESDVCRRQILTYKDGPRTGRIKTIIMTVDPYHYVFKESDRADQEVYDDFKL